MAHILDISDFQGLESKYLIASATEHGVHKRLFIKSIITSNNKVTSMFTVEDHKKEIMVTDNLEVALKNYNSIT
jgi:hypothetical protein